MELRDYFKIIGKHLTVFILVTIISGVAAFFFTKLQPKSYLASTTVTVNKASIFKQKDVSFYMYDNYYNVQSAALFSQIVTVWFSSPSLVKEIYEKAGVPVPNVSQKKLSKTFKAVREEPATIDVSISGTNKNELEKLITAATVVLQEKTDEVGKSSESFYEIGKFTSVITDNNPNLILNTIIGLVIGLLVGVMLVFAIEYFQEEKKA